MFRARERDHNVGLTCEHSSNSFFELLSRRSSRGGCYRRGQSRRSGVDAMSAATATGPGRSRRRSARRSSGCRRKNAKTDHNEMSRFAAAMPGGRDRRTGHDETIPKRGDGDHNSGIRKLGRLQTSWRDFDVYSTPSICSTFPLQVALSCCPDPRGTGRMEHRRGDEGGGRGDLLGEARAAERRIHVHPSA